MEGHIIWGRREAGVNIGDTKTYLVYTWYVTESMYEDKIKGSVRVLKVGGLRFSPIRVFSFNNQIMLRL